MKYSSWLFNRSTPDDRSKVAEGLARCFRLRRRVYEQAVIKLAREIERRARVYNLK